MDDLSMLQAGLSCGQVRDMEIGIRRYSTSIPSFLTRREARIMESEEVEEGAAGLRWGNTRSLRDVHHILGGGVVAIPCNDGHVIWSRWETC